MYRVIRSLYTGGRADSRVCIDYAMITGGPKTSPPPGGVRTHDRSLDTYGSLAPGTVAGGRGPPIKAHIHTVVSFVDIMAEHEARASSGLTGKRRKTLAGFPLPVGCGTR
jgi:hypothetical protein